MPKPRINQVADELLRQAREDKISWELVESREDAFRVSFPDTSLIISRWSPLHNSPWATMRDLSKSLSVDIPTYRLELMSEDGEVVETLLTIPGQSAYRALKETFNLATHQASDTERSIDRVLEHLRGT